VKKTRKITTIRVPNKADDNLLFKGDHNDLLKKLIAEYLLDEQTLDTLKIVTKKRKQISTATESTESRRPLVLAREVTINQNNPPNFESGEIKAVNKAIEDRGYQRNYLLACSFMHLQKALVGCTQDTFFKDILDKPAPIFNKAAKSEKCRKYLQSHRYMFFFAKQLFSALKENIHSGDTTITDDVSWARGIAIMQPFDANNDTEMSKEELNALIKTMRDNHILEGFPSCC